MKFWLSGVKISLSKQKSIRKVRKNQNEKKKEKSLQNKIAMVSVTFVVGVLFIGLMAESSRLEGKVAQYETKKSEVSAKIKDEEARTKEIDELKKYMQTDEYAKEVARDKLGLVEGNQIIFKEEE
ncbi:septum formation initiator family protein [Blautia sp. RD014234]|nr:septum formation initiator family protein [Blautia parvula]